MHTHQNKMFTGQPNTTKTTVRDINSFPLDIKSVQAYGVKKWHKNFHWPIPFEQSMLMEGQVKCAMNELIEENNGNEISDLLLINYKIYLDYSNLLYCLWLLKELKQRNLNPVYSSESVIFKGILETEVPLEQIIKVSSMPRPNIAKKIRSKAGLLKRQLRLNTPIRYLLTSSFGNEVLYGCVSNLNDLGYEYIRTKLGGRVKLINDHSFPLSCKPETVSKNTKQHIRKVTNKLIVKVKQIAIQQNIQLTERQKNYLFDITVMALTKTKINLDALNNCIQKEKHINLLTGANGSQFSRVLSVAIRNNGGSVTTFQHGEPLIFNWDKYDWLEFSLANNYFAYTENLAIALKNMDNEYKPLAGNSTEIHGAKTNMFYNIRQKEAKKPVPDKIERVMMVPQAFTRENQVAQGFMFPALVQLDWELRIINALKKAGYKALYKKHPHGTLINQPMDFIEDAQIIYEPFDEVMDYTDAFLFYHTRSTAFGPALCTNKPIIYIDGGWEKMSEKMRTSLAKRCRIINAHFDERNRMIFDEEKLIEVLSEKPKEPDLEFINTYLFP